MDIIRRNTDYALRLAVGLAGAYRYNRQVSVRKLAQDTNVPYAITSKLLQKLQNCGLLKSTMGSRGGFQLNRPPAEITFLEIVEAIQGKISVNKCLAGTHVCPMNTNCPLHPKLTGLQAEIIRHLKETTLEQTIPAGDKGNLITGVQPQ